jgi:tetratricopeptide (TPR) repeat protein/tRNA A-37 threonylcarbamoyl transferase component Bud32
MNDRDTGAGDALAAADWHRLNALLKDALELDAAARSEWLATLPPAAQDLRPMLERLLDTKLPDGTSQTLKPVVAMAGAAMAAMRAEQPGDRIGPWRLDRLLAEGGMGTVWVAQRADGVMKRTAALKLPRAEWIDRGLRERIARERTILARLQHPHIAVLYDAGIGADGRPYLALEYVDGQPIDAHCRGLDPHATVRLFVLVVRAVAHAHAQLVIHRDIKPSNVLVGPDGTPKLLDFGISKLLEGDAPMAEETALTHLNGRALTLAYAAPEQVLGEPVAVTADVYALGVLLFELLAQTRRYRAHDRRELEAEVLRGDLRLPSAAAPERARARLLRGDLDAVVATALRREPTARYQSAAAFADDLESWLGGRPVRARPDTGAYRLRKFATRNRLPVAAGATVVLALAAGLGAALWQAGEAREQARRATSLNTFVLSLIRQADPNASRQMKAADLSLLATLEERIDGELGDSPEQQLQLRVTVADAYRNRGEVAAARRVLQRAVAAAAPRLPPDHLLLLSTRVRAADPQLIVSTPAAEQLVATIPALRRLGAPAAGLLIDALLHRTVLAEHYGLPTHVKPAQRLEALREADAIAQRHFGAGSPQHLRAARHLAGLIDGMEGPDQSRGVEFMRARADLAVNTCYRTERPQDGQAILAPMVENVRAGHGPTSALLEELLIAQVHCTADRRLGAAYIAEAFEIAAARESAPSMARLHRALSAYDSAVGERDDAKAEGYYRQVQENLEAIPEPALRERLTLAARVGRVCQLAKRGDASGAETLGAPLLAEFLAGHASSGRSTPLALGTAICLSDAKRHFGRHEAAIEDLKAVLEMCRSAPPVWARGCAARPYTALVSVLLDLGRLDEARDAAERRLAVVSGYGGEPRFAVGYGRVLIASGRAGEAVVWLQQAHDGFRDVAPEVPEVAEVRYWLGQARLANGDAQGRTLVEQARPMLAASPLNWHRQLATAKTRPL